MVLNTWYSTIYNSSTNDKYFQKLILFRLKPLFKKMAQGKVPTTAHLAKLEDLLRVVKGIEQEAYDITSVLPSKNNAVLNGKLVTLKQMEVTSATINNDKSIDINTLAEKSVLLYGVGGLVMNVAESLCSIGINNLIVVGKRNIIKRDDFINIGYKDSYEQWTKVRATINRLMDLNANANIEGCDLSVESSGGISMLKYALVNRTLFSSVDIISNDDLSNRSEKEEVFRCYYTSNHNNKSNRKKNGKNPDNTTRLKKETFYRKMVVQLSTPPKAVSYKKQNNLTDLNSKKCVDILIAAVTNRKEALILNNICLELGITLIVASTGMLHGDVTIVRPVQSPCLNCSDNYTKFIPIRGMNNNLAVSIPSIQYVMSGIIINNCIQILLNLKGKSKTQFLEHFNYQFSTSNIISTYHDEKDKHCRNDRCRNGNT